MIRDADYIDYVYAHADKVAILQTSRYPANYDNQILCMH